MLNTFWDFANHQKRHKFGTHLAKKRPKMKKIDLQFIVPYLSPINHIWSESKYDNFDIPNIPKTDPDSPKRALSDRAMG